MRNTLLRCKHPSKVFLYDKLIAVVDSNFVSREVAMQTLPEAKLSLYREKFLGYSYVGRSTFVLCQAMSTQFDLMNGKYGGVMKATSVTEAILDPVLAMSNAGQINWS